MSDRYRLTRLFAKGGMAEVYLGTALGAEGFEKPVAIKRLLPELARDARLAEMFLAEAKLAKFLSHQNVVQVLDVGRSHQELYLVMELVDGWDLELLVDVAKGRGVTFPPHLAAFIASQALAGLIHAYRRTEGGKPLIVAHRDVSGSNILVSREGEVKVTDFGIARMEGLSTERTEPGTFKGKVPYSAPELLRGGTASHASDQFSLGVVLYKLIAGQHPFSDSDQWAAYVAALERDTAAPLNAPPPLAAIVARMLSKSPAQRFETPEALDQALGEYLSRCGEPSSARTLAAFVDGLAPPPSAAEARAAHAGEVLGGTFSLKGQLQAPIPLSVPLEDDGEAWQPSGPALDESGALQRHAPEPTPSFRPPSKEERPLELASPARPSPSPDALELAHAPIVNREVPPDFGGGPPTAVKVRRWLRRALALGLLAGLAAGAYFLGWPLVKQHTPRALLTTPADAPLLYVDSEPSGAQVTIEGVVLGQTPLVLENRYAGQAVGLELRLAGHRPWKGSFRGGEAGRVEAALKRR